MTFAHLVAHFLECRTAVHDGVEALMGGWDPITPLKRHLGEGYQRLVARLQADEFVGRTVAVEQNMVLA